MGVERETVVRAEEARRLNMFNTWRLVGSSFVRLMMMVAQGMNEDGLNKTRMEEYPPA